jgi:hypothetical protein
VNDLLLWALSCLLFLMAVACFVFTVLVNRDEHRYLFWAAVVAWAVLCLALSLVVSVWLL